MTSSSDLPTTSNIEVWIAIPADTAGTPGRGGFDSSGEVEKQALWRKRAEQTVATADTEEFLSSWRKAFAAVDAVFAADTAPRNSRGFELESVTAKLALKASGKVVFIAEVGVEVAFEATFKRRVAIQTTEADGA